MQPAVTGIGGVFIKAKDPKTLAAWYERHLGLPFGKESYIEFRPEPEGGNTVFSFFKQDTDYFKPSEQPYMLNFRVRHLEGLLNDLKNEGVTIVGELQEFEYGKFGWIVDPEGNKIELWEPADEKS